MWNEDCLKCRTAPLKCGFILRKAGTSEIFLRLAVVSERFGEAGHLLHTLVVGILIVLMRFDQDHAGRPLRACRRTQILETDEKIAFSWLGQKHQLNKYFINKIKSHCCHSQSHKTLNTIKIVQRWKVYRNPPRNQRKNAPLNLGLPLQSCF